MTSQMKCHYEILGVQRDATPEDLKKSYRKLALQWHPDKNPDRVDEVTKHFLLIQQAYDVLVDPQERAWYDKHREAILRGGHGRGDQYTDDSLDVFQYFNTSCFTGYGDTEQGFYTVYRKVFEQIAEEDYVFMEDKEDFEMPGFGESASSYEEVVGPFYAYWESFYTAKSFVWVEKYDTREAPDRRVRRLMEAENKKLRDAARKERSEEVRALLAFVRKRDKRVLAYRKKLEQRAEEISRKNAEKREKQVKERLKLLENYEEADWSKMSSLEEEMQKLEANLSEQFGDKQNLSGSDDQDEEEEEIFDDLFCVACNKSFKSDKAFANHERSKKHKDNVLLLKSEMEDEEEITLDGTPQPQAEGVTEEFTETLPETKQKFSKRQKKKRKERAQQAVDEDDGIDTVSLTDSTGIDTSEVVQVVKPSSENEACNENGTSVSETMTRGETSENDDDTVQATANQKNEEVVGNSTTASQENEGNKERKLSVKNTSKANETNKEASKPQFCNVCHKEFPTRNKLFQHVKTEGHALHLSPEVASSADKASGKKKARRKGKNL